MNKHQQNIIDSIMDSNTMLEWIEYVGTNQYGGGPTYSLYLDLVDNSLSIDCQADSQTYLYRNDGTMVRIATYSNLDSELIDPYDDWESNYRSELEGEIFDTLYKNNED